MYCRMINVKIGSLNNAHFRGLVNLNGLSHLTCYDGYLGRSTWVLQRSRSRQCHLPVQTFSPILSYIVKLFILNTSLVIKSRLKSNFIMIFILKTYLPIRIHAAVMLLRSVVIRFVNIDRI